MNQAQSGTTNQERVPWQVSKSYSRNQHVQSQVPRPTTWKKKSPSCQDRQGRPHKMCGKRWGPAPDRSNKKKKKKLNSKRAKGISADRPELSNKRIVPKLWGTNTRKNGLVRTRGLTGISNLHQSHPQEEKAGQLIQTEHQSKSLFTAVLTKEAGYETPVTHG